MPFPPPTGAPTPLDPLRQRRARLVLSGDTRMHTPPGASSDRRWPPHACMHACVVRCGPPALVRVRRLIPSRAGPSVPLPRHSWKWPMVTLPTYRRIEGRVPIGVGGTRCSCSTCDAARGPGTADSAGRALSRRPDIEHAALIRTARAVLASYPPHRTRHACKWPGEEPRY